MNYKAIHRNVLVVARIRDDGTWKAYVFPVPGYDHEGEAWSLWRTAGTQLPEIQARPFFPELAETKYAR
jgi:hypothetical protein